MKKKMLVKKVISGGQTGVDQAGLEAAKELGIKTGGYIPRGFLTENGSDYSLKKFNLTEMKSTSYVIRSIFNVDNSDGTIAFRLKSSPGTDKTIGYCQTNDWTSYN
ncbi:unnamed protein product, partial [marine sediment metagenome]